MKVLILFAGLVVGIPAGVAFAQQQGAPAEQAMGAKIIQEIQLGLQCNAELISVRAELVKAQARLKELEPPKEAK